MSDVDPDLVELLATVLHEDNCPDEECEGADFGEYERAARLSIETVQHKIGARALREAGQQIDWTWEVFIAPDGVPSIRMHGKDPQQLLAERAAWLEDR